ncbi:hypothetical protein [Methylobacterium sp. 77]|nr:hypothetical protein [Methylobacterium sp. 77]
MRLARPLREMADERYVSAVIFKAQAMGRGCRITGQEGAINYGDDC